MDRFNLGTYQRCISTASAETQRWFDIGLNWCYCFNHEEGIRCFEKALQYDPDCPFVHWGIAYAAGPFYNLTWTERGKTEVADATKRCFKHVQLALSSVARASEIERQLIEALALHFQKPFPVTLQEFEQWDDAYAAQMRLVHRNFPNDQDVMALLIEALMMRTVRRLWDIKIGTPAPNSNVIEALDICDKSFRLADRDSVAQHPAVLHLHIHLLEMSPFPERGILSANLLSDMCPDAGHMNHMPAHIYVLCGDYEKAKRASVRAIRANDLYLAYAQDTTFYLLGCCHDLHLMMFTCMLSGQYEAALWSADKTRKLVTPSVLNIPNRPKLTESAEGYYAMKSHVLVRFGRWQDIIDESMVEDPDLYLLTATMQHYAKGIAYATLKQFDEAERERKSFHQQWMLIPPERRFLSNLIRDSVAVGAALLDGELAYHQGRHDEAYGHLRLAVELHDSLAYTEPWAWMHPPRHALAALLLDQGHLKEAEQIYRDDLGLGQRLQRCTQHPNNIWALHGLVECLETRGETTELPAMKEKLDKALAMTDVPISSSCLCRTSA
jgi:tetratricopeptide (TPR) repeat protein